MPIVVNSNPAATTAAFNLSRNHANLGKSLARLSSGQRITQSSDDAGGMAVAYKLNSTVMRTQAALNNHQNALSYLQVQDGALESVGNIVSRMAELRTMAADITKNDGDIENYSKEFRELQSQLQKMSVEKFNGIRIFSDQNVTPGTTQGLEKAKSKSGNAYADGQAGFDATYTKVGFELLTHPSGETKDGSISLNVVNMNWLTMLPDNVDHDNDAATAVQKMDLAMLEDPAGVNQVDDVAISMFTAVIQKIADARAENGAEQQRIQTSYALHSSNLVNLEAAHGRIMDVDVALESTRYARHNVLVQASASMTAQANQLTQVALTLLQ
jgi:flagellin